MAKGRIKPHHKKSPIKQYVEEKEKTSIEELEIDSKFLLSFEHLDKSQGSTFKDWERENILSSALNTLKGYCSRKLKSAQDKKFTIYGDFPPSAKSKFNHPKHVPQDAKWARIHVKGKQIIAGHVVKNIFYVVFLDDKHEFWITSKK